MDLERLFKTDFVLLDAAWPAVESRALLKQVDASHVIVRWQSNGADTYYLFTRQDALTTPPNGTTVREIFALDRQEATPRVAVDTPITEAPEKAIVFDDDERLAGYFDRDLMTFGAITRGAPTPAAADAGLEAIPQAAAAGAPTADGAAAEEVQRSLVAELTDTIPLNQIVSLLVSLTSTPTVPTGALPLKVAVGDTIDIVVRPRAGVVIEGPSDGTITVSGEPESLPLQFKVRGTEIGPAKVRVLAFQQGQPLGELMLTAVVKEAVAEAPAAAAAPPVQQPLAAVSVRRPDLSLLILEERDDDETVLTMLLSASDPALSLGQKRFPEVRLKSDPARYFAEQFSDIEALSLATPDDRKVAELKVGNKGTNLFTTILPPELQQKLWELRNRITSIQVYSDEPWIPWEILRLRGEEDGQVKEGPFLCEAFAITRWLMNVDPQSSLKLANLAVVVPDDSKLAFAPGERDYLLSLAAPGRAVTRVPAKFDQVLAALASGAYDGWHFSGHGASRSQDPNKSSIYLENQVTLTPEDLSGAAANLSHSHPLVFLNACQVGQAGMSLTDIGGWAKKFLESGAAGFIGTYWSVTDEPAFKFAKALYGRLITGTPIGQAAKEARAEIKADGDPTWLAYTVFADPWAAVATTA